MVAVLTAVNENIRYLDCEKWFFSFWNTISGSSECEYVPICLHFQDDGSAGIRIGSIDEPKQLLFDEVGVHTVFAAQFSRVIFGATLEQFDVVLTSDIDMIPLSSDFFDRIVREALKKQWTFVIGRDVLGPSQAAICYLAAAPDTWRNVNALSEPSDWLGLLRREFQKMESIPYSGKRGSHGWFSDQIYIAGSVRKAESDRTVEVVRLIDTDTGFRRFDRTLSHRLLLPKHLKQISKGLVSDHHLIHPVKNHEKLLVKLLSLIQPPIGPDDPTQP